MCVCVHGVAVLMSSYQCCCLLSALLLLQVSQEPRRDLPPSARNKISAGNQQQQQQVRPERAGSSTQRGQRGETRACGTESGCGEDDNGSDATAEVAVVMPKAKGVEKGDCEYVDSLPNASGASFTGAQLPSLPNRPANGPVSSDHHQQPVAGHKPVSAKSGPSNLCTKFGSVTYASALRATITPEHPPSQGMGVASSVPVTTAHAQQQQSRRNSAISRTSSRVSTPSVGPESSHSIPVQNMQPSSFEKTPSKDAAGNKNEMQQTSGEFALGRESDARPHQDELALQSPSHLLSRVGGGGQGSPHLVDHFSQSAPHSPARIQQPVLDGSFNSPGRAPRPVGSHSAASRGHVALPTEEHWPVLSQEEVGKPLALAATVAEDHLNLRPSSAQDRILESLQQPCYPPNSPFSHSLPDNSLDFKHSPLSSDSAVYSSYTPLTRTSSVPSKLPLSSPMEEQEEVIRLSPSPSVDAEEQEQAAANDDNPVQSNKSSLNITATVFVPGKKPFVAKSASQPLQRHAHSSGGSGTRSKRPVSSEVVVSSSAPQLVGQQPQVQQQQQQQQQHQQQQQPPPLLSQPPFPIHLLQTNPFQLAAIIAAAAAEQRKNSLSQSLSQFQSPSVPVSIPLPQAMPSVVHSAQPATAHSALHMSSFIAPPVHSAQLNQAHLSQPAAMPSYAVKPRQLTLTGGYESIRHAVPNTAVQYIEKDKLVRSVKANHQPPMPSTPVIFPPRPMVQHKPLPLQSPLRPQGTAVSRIPTALSVLATPTGLRSPFAHMQQPTLAGMGSGVPGTPSRTLLAPSMTQTVVVPGNIQQLPVQQAHAGLIPAAAAPLPTPQQQSSQSAPALDSRRVTRPPLLPTPPGFGYITPSQTTPARTVSTPTTVLHPPTWPVTGTPGLHLQASPLPSVLAEQHTASVSAMPRTTYPISGSL